MINLYRNMKKLMKIVFLITIVSFGFVGALNLNKKVVDNEDLVQTEILESAFGRKLDPYDYSGSTSSLHLRENSPFQKKTSNHHLVTQIGESINKKYLPSSHKWTQRTYTSKSDTIEVDSSHEKKLVREPNFSQNIPELKNDVIIRSHNAKGSKSYLDILGIPDFDSFEIPVIGGFASPPVVKLGLVKAFHVDKNETESEDQPKTHLNDSLTSQSIKQEHTHGQLKKTDSKPDNTMDFFNFLSNLKATPRPNRKSLSQLIAEKNANFIGERDNSKKIERKENFKFDPDKSITDNSFSETIPSESIHILNRHRIMNLVTEEPNSILEVKDIQLHDVPATSKIVKTQNNLNQNNKRDVPIAYYRGIPNSNFPFGNNRNIKSFTHRSNDHEITYTQLRAPPRTGTDETISKSPTQSDSLRNRENSDDITKQTMDYTYTSPKQHNFPFKKTSKDRQFHNKNPIDDVIEGSVKDSNAFAKTNKQKTSESNLISKSMEEQFQLLEFLLNKNGEGRIDDDYGLFGEPSHDENAYGRTLPNESLAFSDITSSHSAIQSQKIFPNAGEPEIEFSRKRESRDEYDYDLDDLYDYYYYDEDLSYDSSTDAAEFSDVSGQAIKSEVSNIEVAKNIKNSHNTKLKGEFMNTENDDQNTPFRYSSNDGTESFLSMIYLPGRRTNIESIDFSKAFNSRTKRHVEETSKNPPMNDTTPVISSGYANVSGNMSKEKLASMKKVKNRYVRPNLVVDASTTSKVEFFVATLPPETPKPSVTQTLGENSTDQTTTTLRTITTESISPTTTTTTTTAQPIITSDEPISISSTERTTTISSNQAYINEVYKKKKKSGINIGNPLNITNLEAIPNLTKTLKSFLLKDGISYKKVQDTEVQGSKVTAKNVPKEVVRERIRLLRLLKEHKASIENSPFSRSNHSYLQVRTPVKLFQVLNGEIKLTNRTEASINQIPTQRPKNNDDVEGLFEQILQSGNIEQFFNYYLSIHQDCEAIRDRDKYTLCEYFRSSLGRRPRPGRNSNDPLYSIGSVLKSTSKAVPPSSFFTTRSRSRNHQTNHRTRFQEAPSAIQRSRSSSQSRNKNRKNKPASLDQFLLKEPERVRVSQRFSDQNSHSTAQNKERIPSASQKPNFLSHFQSNSQRFTNQKNSGYPSGSFDYQREFYRDDSRKSFGRIQPHRDSFTNDYEDTNFDYYDFQRTSQSKRSPPKITKVSIADSNNAPRETLRITSKSVETESPKHSKSDFNGPINSQYTVSQPLRRSKQASVDPRNPNFHRIGRTRTEFLHKNNSGNHERPLATRNHISRNGMHSTQTGSFDNPNQNSLPTTVHSATRLKHERPSSSGDSQTISLQKENKNSKVSLINQSFDHHSMPMEIPGAPGRDYPTYSTIPETAFQCPFDDSRDQIFVDFEARCQVYHHCRSNIKTSFLCPPGKMFDLKTRRCQLWIHVTCR